MISLQVLSHFSILKLLKKSKSLEKLTVLLFICEKSIQNRDIILNQFESLSFQFRLKLFRKDFQVQVKFVSIRQPHFLAQYFGDQKWLLVKD